MFYLWKSVTQFVGSSEKWKCESFCSKISDSHNQALNQVHRSYSHEVSPVQPIPRLVYRPQHLSQYRCARLRRHYLLFQPAFNVICKWKSYPGSNKDTLLLHQLPKAFVCVDHNKLWKILKEMGIPDHLTCLLWNKYSGQETTEPEIKQWTGSKLGKEYIKAVYCHSACLTCMQSTSCKMSGWMKHKQESRLSGRNSNNLRYANDTTLLTESEELKSLLKVKKESENVGIKLNIQRS